MQYLISNLIIIIFQISATKMDNSKRMQLPEIGKFKNFLK